MYNYIHYLSYHDFIIIESQIPDILEIKQIEIGFKFCKEFVSIFTNYILLFIKHVNICMVKKT